MQKYNFFQFHKKYFQKNNFFYTFVVWKTS